MADPLPLPLAPDVIVIQPALLVAVHAQPAPAVTPTLNAPPAETTVVLLVGAKVYVHDAASCVSAKL